jgi:NitT/TauT family transport system substrate-binding protein
MNYPAWTAGLLLSLLALGQPAAAETREIRLARQFDLPALPLMVAEHDRLIEKQAATRNLGTVIVHWQRPGPTDPLAALAAGDVDIVAVSGLAEFVTGWDQTVETPNPIRALGALGRIPYLLLTRNPTVAKLRDFTAKDRIAVPVLKLSTPAILLEMAAAHEWGEAHFDQLDALVVARSDADADTALHSGKGDIDTHFSRPPFANDELGDPAIHNVLDSFDIAGPHSAGAVVTTGRFHDANPALCAAIVAAIDEADLFIKQHPGAAAEIYAEMTHNRDLGVEDLTDMLSDPDIGFATSPVGIQRLADFMGAIGRSKHRPATWKDLFFPEIYAQPGS